MNTHGQKALPQRPRPGGVLSQGPALHPRLIGLLLVGVGLLLYWPVVMFDFVNYDDGEYFAANSHVLAGWTAEGLRWAFSTGYAANWHPLTWLSLMLDAQLFGPRAAGPHFTNLLLHATNGFLVFFLLHRMTGLMRRSAVVGALFIVHPLHVESVAWVSERKDVLSTFFGLLSLWAYTRYVEASMSAGPVGRRPRRWFYGLALLCFALSLMSKPMLVTLPCILLLLDYWPLQRLRQKDGSPFWPQFTRLACEKWPFFLLSAASSAVTLWAQAHGGAVRPLDSLPLTPRFENALVSYLRYLGKAVWPTHLAVLYPHPEHWPAILVLLAALLLAAGGLATLVYGRRLPFVAVGWLWFLGVLVPVIGLVQVGVQSMADRYMYVPLLGLLILGVWGGSEAARLWKLPKPILISLTTLVLLGFALRARDQLHYWCTGEDLFRHAIAVTEHNALASGYLENNLGNNLYRQGRLEEAVQHYESSLHYFPNFPLAHNNLAIALAADGRFQEAIDHYTQALRLQPDYANAWVNLGDTLLATHQDDQGIAAYRKALALDPLSVQAWNNLGTALTHRGAFAEAADCCRQVVRLQPDFIGGYNNLAAALLAQSKLEEAMRCSEQALRLAPADARANFLLGTAFAKAGRVDDALRQFQEVSRLRPDFPGVHEQIQALERARAQGAPSP